MKKKRSLLLIIYFMLALLVSACASQPQAAETSVTERTEQAVQTKETEGTESTPGESLSESIPEDSSSEESSTQTAEPEKHFLEVHFLDVGQGDASLVICDGEAMLIDGGGADKSGLIYSYLKKHHITHLKYIIATHPDEDHIGGLAGALNLADAEYAFSSSSEYEGSRAFEYFIKYLGDTVLTVPEPGQEISLGSSEGVILGPINQSEESNNNSIVIRLVFGNTSFLFTGDALEAEEKDILDSGAEISADVLKVAHHGSSTSTCYEFLNAVAPDYAVISCGARNDYHHPNDNILERLENAGITLYRTDLHGHIICRSDGETLSFEVTNDPGISAYSTYDELYPPEISSDIQEEREERLYILNTSSRLIHVPFCESAGKMSERNRKEETGTLKEIMEKYPDFRPCQRCRALYPDQSGE